MVLQKDYSFLFILMSNMATAVVFFCLELAEFDKMLLRNCSPYWTKIIWE